MLNGDGGVDILVADAEQAPLSVPLKILVLVNSPSTRPMQPVTSPAQIVGADFNGDGIADMAASITHQTPLRFTPTRCGRIR